MATKIRLARGGAKKRPHYRVVVANAIAPRDGDFLEKVGTYDPMLVRGDANRVVLKSDRIEYWLSTGAQPTDRVARFMWSTGRTRAVQASRAATDFQTSPCRGRRQCAAPAEG